MKKIIYFSIAIIVLLLVGGLPVYASGSQGGGHGGYGGHGSYGSHGGYYGRGHGGGVVWIGPGWWDPWWGPPYYPYYYSDPPEVIQQQAPVYEQQTPVEEQQNYWYFCPDSKAYYPYVKQCPGGWLKVVPTPGPPK